MKEVIKPLKYAVGNKIRKMMQDIQDRDLVVRLNIEDKGIGKSALMKKYLEEPSERKK